MGGQTDSSSGGKQECEVDYFHYLYELGIS
jgi:hypothetical protein